jgi:hypothetical protein
VPGFFLPAALSQENGKHEEDRTNRPGALAARLADRAAGSEAADAAADASAETAGLWTNNLPVMIMGVINNAGLER